MKKVEISNLLNCCYNKGIIEGEYISVKPFNGKTDITGMIYRPQYRDWCYVTYEFDIVDSGGKRVCPSDEMDIFDFIDEVEKGWLV